MSMSRLMCGSSQARLPCRDLQQRGFFDLESPAIDEHILP